MQALKTIHYLPFLSGHLLQQPKSHCTRSGLQKEVQYLTIYTEDLCTEHFSFLGSRSLAWWRYIEYAYTFNNKYNEWGTWTYHNRLLFLYHTAMKICISFYDICDYLCMLETCNIIIITEKGHHTRKIGMFPGTLFT